MHADVTTKFLSNSAINILGIVWLMDRGVECEGFLGSDALVVVEWCVKSRIAMLGPLTILLL